MGDYDVMLVHPVCSRCHQEGPQMIPDSILVSETLSLARACAPSCPLLFGWHALPRSPRLQSGIIHGFISQNASPWGPCNVLFGWHALHPG